ncbi:hypothetical protein G5714_006534 [Onychostoma macrolepis]|uniref:Uncharacterized protein n=1 Tax=Onychostoma macrolepis TaxID=369639 RepID=A0A7J6D429_9TELE|nr:hypothetical protein G5714_006534 [Onychostoma macrolepis]
MVLDQILPSFGPNHHKGIRIWSGAGPVLVQIRKKRIHAGIGPLCQKTPAQMPSSFTDSLLLDWKKKKKKKKKKKEEKEKVFKSLYCHQTLSRNK